MDCGTKLFIRNIQPYDSVVLKKDIGVIRGLPIDGDQ